MGGIGRPSRRSTGSSLGMEFRQWSKHVGTVERNNEFKVIRSRPTVLSNEEDSSLFSQDEVDQGWRHFSSHLAESPKRASQLTQLPDYLPLESGKFTKDSALESDKLRTELEEWKTLHHQLYQFCIDRILPRDSTVFLKLGQPNSHTFQGLEQSAGSSDSPTESSQVLPSVNPRKKQRRKTDENSSQDKNRNPSSSDRKTSIDSSPLSIKQNRKKKKKKKK